MGIAKVSNILRMARDYRLSIEERMMFDWLVVKQEDFGLEKPFRHSIPQVQEATGIARHSQEKAMKHFTSLGFLKIGTDYYQNNPYRTYFVNFSILGKPEVLREIIKADTETFKDFSEWINELAAKQAKQEKPLSKTKQKQLEKEKAKAEADTEILYNRLCETWKSRVDLYNNGELTGEMPKRTKIYDQLPLGLNGKRLLWRLSKKYDGQTICNAFVVYADGCLIETIKPRNIFLYFLKYEDGDFPVVDDMINYHALNYGKNRS